MRKHSMLIKLLVPAAALALLSACSGIRGYGVLLWSTEDPSIASGTVLPVYIKSNIDQVWVVGVPGTKQKIELPLWKLEYAGGKSKARERAAALSEYATIYAQTTTDGLPVREDPDNLARRLYRLRMGQIVKVLGKAEGAPAMAGEAPLPGEWLLVLTEDGTVGYCFSYRLRVFDQADGKPESTASVAAETDLRRDLLLSRVWYPESYQTMLDERRIDLERFRADYGFFPGADTGVLRLATSAVSFEQPYTSVAKVRDDVYRFEGTSIQATLRADDILSVQYLDANGAQRSLLFVALPVEVNDIVEQEKERRDALLQAIRAKGPVFRSENYGTLSFTSGGGFYWSGYDLLVPAAVPQAARGTGSIELRLFLDDPLPKDYDGAISFRFDGLDPQTTIDFLYRLEPAGVRLEYLPRSSIDGVVVRKRGSSPTVIAFSGSEG